MSKIKFKNTGKLKKDFIKKENYKDAIHNSNKKPIGIKLPLSAKKNSNKTLFNMTYSVSDQVKVNFKNLILTRKGEYLGMPDFGTNLIDLYNQTDLEEIEEIVMDEIRIATTKYMPFINLVGFSSKKIEETFENPEYYVVNIDYTILDSIERHKATIKLLTSR